MGRSVRSNGIGSHLSRFGMVDDSPPKVKREWRMLACRGLRDGRTDARFVAADMAFLTRVIPHCPTLPVAHRKRIRCALHVAGDHVVPLLAVRAANL